MSIMFNEICINEEMQPKYTYIYIYAEREREREREILDFGKFDKMIKLFLDKERSIIESVFSVG